MSDLLKILFAEDSQSLRELMFLRIMKSKVPVELDVAKDGVEALNLASQNRYHIVISDYEMPNLDGFGVAKGMREIDPMSHLILWSANYEGIGTQFHKDALKVGFSEFWSKSKPNNGEIVKSLRSHHERVFPQLYEKYVA